MYSLDRIIAMNEQAERKEKAERAAVVDRVVNGYPPADPVKLARDREKCRIEREKLMNWIDQEFPETAILRQVRKLEAVNE